MWTAFQPSKHITNEGESGKLMSSYRSGCHQPDKYSTSITKSGAELSRRQAARFGVANRQFAFQQHHTPTSPPPPGCALAQQRLVVCPVTGRVFSRNEIVDRAVGSRDEHTVRTAASVNLQLVREPRSCCIRAM